jgi:hypothetical protein
MDAEDAEGNTLRAVTYVAQGNEFDRSPSLQDITLMQEGARKHGLREYYFRCSERIEHAR